MLRLVGWSATAILLGLALWQVLLADPTLPRWISGPVLIVVSSLVGLRIATDATAAYIKDLQRVNKVLADQNHELEETNAELLKVVGAELESPAVPEQN